MLAKTNLRAAITSEEAYSCANRMKIDAVDTARIPPIKARVITGLDGLELI
jgi:hypothetical protein